MTNPEKHCGSCGHPGQWQCLNCPRRRPGQPPTAARPPCPGTLNDVLAFEPVYPHWARATPSTSGAVYMHDPLDSEVATTSQQAHERYRQADPDFDPLGLGRRAAIEAIEADLAAMAGRVPCAGCAYAVVGLYAAHTCRAVQGALVSKVNPAHGDPGHHCTWACPQADPLRDIRTAMRPPQWPGHTGLVVMDGNIVHPPPGWEAATGHVANLFAGPVLNRRQRLAQWLRIKLRRPARNWDGWVQLGAIDDTPDGFTQPIGDQPSED